MYKISDTNVTKIDKTTFSNINYRESDIEELLRKNIEMICDDEESMLIVGKQVRNASNGISDLTAIDHEGNIVLIEIKRDRKDIERRKEAFEFQAIRYAASYATIEDVEDLVKRIYAPYIEKYRGEFESGPLTSTELGTRKVLEFLRENGKDSTDFNNKQKIILVAADYDEQTLSAVAWLNSNTVDISCYKLIPYQINDDLYISTEKVLPVNSYHDFYVPFTETRAKISSRKETTRRNLPKIDAMLEWGVVKAGDIIVAKGKEVEGVLLANGNVQVNGEEQSMQRWLKGVFGWSSVQTYMFAVHQETGKTLSELRAEYMEREKEEDTLETWN
ncbi:hypothetical protein [Sporosarcina sp. UB5]|uniref:hypothetical protein n=1 Tax=Sporosarcina sp. UB5 TaxID=3047463 RepID=UPI003D7969D3